MESILKFVRQGGLQDTGQSVDGSSGARPRVSREIEADIPAGPLKATAVVEAIQSEAANGNETKATAAVCGETTLGNEQYLRLTIELPSTDNCAQESSRQEFTHVIVVADRSGSMAGNPWRQVQDALKQIVGDSYSTSDKQHVTVIIYNNKAKVGTFTQENYLEVIDGLKCSGTTSFSAAFDAVSGSITSVVGSRRVTRTIIAFMTDGQDTHLGNRQQLLEAVQTWKTKLARQDHPVIVHSVGFSGDHDYDFMCKLIEAGTEAGMYRYCQPDDGRDALRMKLSELFQYISAEENEVDVEVSLGGDDKLIGMGELTGTAVIRGPIRKIKMEKKEEGKDEEACATNEIKAVVAETWIYVADPTRTPDVGAVVHFPKGKNDVVQVHCEVAGVERKVVTDDRDKVMWSVRILSRNTDVLTTKVGEAIKTGKGDVAKLSQRLKRLQERISKTKVYGRGITKEFRMAVLDVIKEIQTKVDMMHKMLAEYTRDKTSSVELLARANDLRYAAQFSKGRRQRLMDMRASRNLGQAQKAQQALDTMVIDKLKLEKLSHEALDFFFCVLSQNNIKEMLLDPDEKTDAIGFGLAVMRPEHVLDEPTGVWVHQISGTLVSRSAMMDAVQHRINVDGHLNTHGGFNFGENNRMGVATVGASREPINAWLPLYVCDQHWERVKTLMKPILGYFCTLDDLGYDYKQMDVMFLILGSMIGQISPERCGEHQVRLLTAFHRTCHALCKDFGMIAQMTELVRNFIKTGEGRTRDCVPSLYALIGYVVSLPDYALKALFPAELPDGRPDMSRFWLAFISENLRRAARNQFRDTADSVVLGVIDAILHGNPDDLELVADALQALLAHKPEGAEACAAPPAFDVSEGVEVVTLERKHEIRVDKAMALWAQAACGHIVNKSRLPAVNAAKKVVNEWVEAGKVKAKTTKADAEPQKQLDVNAINKSAVEALAKMLKRLLSVTHPNLEGVVGSMAYLEYWLKEQLDFTEVDQNSGLVPDHWVEKLRKAVKKVYNCMDDQLITPTGESSAVGNDSETVNITVTDAQIVAEAVTEAVPETEEDIYTANTAEETASTVDDPVKGSDDDDGDDSDYNYSSDDYDDDDDGVATARRQAHRQRKKTTTKTTANLPCVLRYVLSNSERTDDVVVILRGMVCQGLYFNNNTRARDASKDGTMMDLAQGSENAVVALERLHDSLQEKRDGYLAKLEERATWQRANYCMVQATMPWSFIGYLMNTFTERGEGVAELVELLTDPEKFKNIPYVGEKLRIIVKGQYKGEAVLANGNMWLPEKKTGLKMAETMGDEEWTALEIEIRSNVAIHVYRESDIPNRHGHCNSNPYIPNSLRLKLGMELLKEKQPVKNSRLKAAIGM